MIARYPEQQLPAGTQHISPLASRRLRRWAALPVVITAVFLWSWTDSLAQSERDRINLVRELATGRDAPSPPYEFAFIGRAAVTSSQQLFLGVFDGRQVEVRRFDRHGRYLGVVGRSGAGPGEYRNIEAMAVVGDSLLVIFDTGNGRVSLYDTSGVHRASFGVPGGSLAPHSMFGICGDSLLAIRTRLTGRRGSYTLATAFVRYTLRGRIIDSIPVPPTELGVGFLTSRTLGTRWPFSSITVSTILSDCGVASARTTSYRVDIVRAGRPALHLERSVESLPLLDREREEWQTLVRGGSPLSSLPGRKPLIRELTADPGGRLWVSVYTEPVRREYPARPGEDSRNAMTLWEPNVYDLFDRGGRYLGRLNLPPFSRLLAVHDDRIWISQETDDGGYELLRYRMRMPGS